MRKILSLALVSLVLTAWAIPYTNRVKVNGKWYWIDPTLERYLWKDLYEGYSILEYW